MDTNLLSTLPLGASQEFIDGINKCSIPVTNEVRQLFNGFTVILDNTFPLTLKDGTIVDAVMLGANSSRCYFIREKNELI
jgi:hypothetical protein